jgi:ComF family protein
MGLAGRKLTTAVASGATVVVQGVVAVLFPSDCRLCGAPLTNISRLPVCESCLLAMTPIAGATCEVCGEGLAARGASEPVCAACVETKPYFAKAASYGAYEGELRELIHLLKYEQVESAAGVLGQMLAEAIEKLELNTDSVLVVPVPLHRSKRRQRGFNQAELILRAALRQKPLPNAELAADVLQRTRSTLSQIGLTRSQRAENIRGAFQVKYLNRVEGREVLLVDDVLTTGTTANECARILHKAGAQKVWVATVARTLKENTGNFRVDLKMRKANSFDPSAIAAKAS